MDKEFQKVKCKLVGTDGNIFALISTAMRALQKAGFHEKAVEMRQRIMLKEEAKSYDEAIAIILEYVDEGEDENEQKTEPAEFKKVKCDFFGDAGKYVSLMLTLACNALRRAGYEKKAEELAGRVQVGRKFKEYEEARAIIFEYIEEEN